MRTGLWASLVVVVLLASCTHEEASPTGARSPQGVGATHAYRGVNYVSWTTGDYPWTSSWKAQMYVDSRGIARVEMTREKSCGGNGSLALVLDIWAKSTGKRQGETFVDLRYHMPVYAAERPVRIQTESFQQAGGARGERPIGVDLGGKVVEVMVYCPPQAAGHRSYPSGVQLYAKSMSLDATGRETWLSYYGNWHNIYPRDKNWTTDPLLGDVRAGRWSKVRLELPPAASWPVASPRYGYADAGFDARHVAIIGVKYGLNDRGVASGAVGDVTSRVWIDDLSWSDADGSNPVRFDFEQGETPVDRLKRLGFNTLGIVNTEYCADRFSTSIAPVVGKSHSIDEMRALIQEGKRAGLKVVLKPHVDCADDEWRGRFGPPQGAGEQERERWYDDWFARYEAWIVRYARVAEEHDIEMLVVGTEFKSLTGAGHRTRWERVISAVRRAYSGKITYAANWGHYQDVCLWDLVDVVGIDAYFPTSDSADPPIEDLVRGWSRAPFDVKRGRWGGAVRDWTADLDRFRERVGKPVIFTEIGYRSTDHAARLPWEYQESHPVNTALQACCYRAVLDAFRERPWFQGGLWWYWSPKQDAGGPNNTDFTPQYKPAERVYVEG